jgi:hypothetical protein
MTRHAGWACLVPVEWVLIDAALLTLARVPHPQLPSLRCSWLSVAAMDYTGVGDVCLHSRGDAEDSTANRKGE